MENQKEKFFKFSNLPVKIGVGFNDGQSQGMTRRKAKMAESRWKHFFITSRFMIFVTRDTFQNSWRLIS